MRLLFLIPVLFLLGCSNEPENKVMKLVVSLDSSYLGKTLDFPILFNASYHRSSFYKYDTISKKINFGWDSLAPGTYTFQQELIIGNKINLDLNISSDTIISVASLKKLQDVDSLSFHDFLNSDNCEVILRTTGCFSDQTEKIVLRKNEKNDYVISSKKVGTSATDGNLKDINKIVRDSLIKDVYDLYQNLPMEKMCMSTTCESIYIVTDNKYYYRLHLGIGGRSLFEDLKAKYGL